MPGYKAVCAYKDCQRRGWTDKEHRFHYWPMDQIRADIWAENSGRRDLIGKPRNLVRSYTICKDHFTESDYDNSKKLFKTAVPVRFDAEALTTAMPGYNVICSYKDCQRRGWTDKEHRFHYWPAQQPRADIWAENSGRPDLIGKPRTKTRGYTICKDHFTESDYDYRKKLCKTAVPIRFDAALREREPIVFEGPSSDEERTEDEEESDSTMHRPVTCAYKDCMRQRWTDKEHRFHHFPSDQTRTKIWAENSGRPDLIGKPRTSTRGYTICNDHFKATDYDCRKRLLRVAVPIRFDAPLRERERVVFKGPFTNKASTADHEKNESREEAHQSREATAEFLHSQDSCEPLEFGESLQEESPSQVEMQSPVESPRSHQEDEISQVSVQSPVQSPQEEEISQVELQSPVESPHSQEEIPEVELTSLCRMCARVCSEEAFQPLTPGGTLAQRIADFFNVQLDLTEPLLPCHICPSCSVALDTWWGFRELFHSAQTFFSEQLHLRALAQTEEIADTKLDLQLDTREYEDSPEEDFFEPDTHIFEPECENWETFPQQPSQSDPSLPSTTQKSISKTQRTSQKSGKKSLVVPSSEKPNKSKINIYKCGNCDKNFYLLRHLEEHVKSHSPVVVCSKCGSQFSQVDLFMYHTKSCLRKDTSVTCDFCQRVCSTKPTLKNHIRAVHLESNYLGQCDICHRPYANIRRLFKHMETEHPEYNFCSERIEDRNFTYTCGICSKILNSLEWYRIHLQNDHSKGMYSCGVCKVKFSRVSFLLKHEEAHKVRPELAVAYRCHFCGQVLGSLSGLTGHMKRMHEIIRSDFKKLNVELSKSTTSEFAKFSKFVCGLCEKEFISVDDFGMHFFTDHKQYNTLNCGVCEAKFSKLTQLVKHEKMHKVFPEREIEFMCRHCIFSAIDPIGLKKHILKSHTGHNAEPAMLPINNNNFECLKCREKFPNLAEYDLHNFYHKTNIKCGFCYEKCRNWDDLKKHAGLEHAFTSTDKNLSTLKTYPGKVRNYKPKSAGEIPKFPCPECGKTFRSENLEAHVATHSSERNFVCEICAKSYKSQSTLINHRKTHSAPKYQCEMCHRLFTFKCALRKHIFSHLDYHAYKCKFCTKGFRGLSELKKHLNSIHTPKYFQCTVCGDKFKAAVTLRKHMNQKCNVPIEELPYERESQFRKKVPQFLLPQNQQRVENDLFYVNQSDAAMNCETQISVIHNPYF